jgi:hypothetical protein
MNLCKNWLINRTYDVSDSDMYDQNSISKKNMPTILIR